MEQFDSTVHNQNDWWISRFDYDAGDDFRETFAKTASICN